MEYFTTSDTALASWLELNKVKLDHCENNGKVVFYFDYTDKIRLDSLFMQWYNNSANGNCKDYHRIYKGLLRKINNGKP